MLAGVFTVEIRFGHQDRHLGAVIVPSNRNGARLVIEPRPLFCARCRFSVRREAVQQARAAGRRELLQAAALRRVDRVP